MGTTNPNPLENFANASQDPNPQQPLRNRAVQLVTKLALGIVATVLVLVLGIVLAVTLILDPNDYRAAITQTVQERTGRTLALEGELGLRFLPCCGITVGTAELSNPANFPAGHLARLDAATLSVRLWPLLTRREVVLGDITLRGLDVQLLALADGRTNWAFTDASGPDANEDQATSVLDTTTVAGLRIEGGAVRFVDEVNGTEISATGIGLQTGAIEPNTPFALEASLQLG